MTKTIAPTDRLVQLRIVIDDADRDGDPNQPLTMNVYRDNVDGTLSADAVVLDGDAIVGSSIPDMLEELAREWRASELDPDDGIALPECSECSTPVQVEAFKTDHGMCSSCLHNAVRSGWEPGDD